MNIKPNQIQFCFICYKNFIPSDSFPVKIKTPVDNHSDNRLQYRREILHRFCKLSARHLGFGVNENVKIQENPQVCDTCLPLLETFCRLYQLWEQLQFQVSWQMRLIAGEMMPVLTLETQRFGPNEPHRMGASSDGNGNWMNFAQNKAIIEAADEFRRNFLLKVDQKSKEFPQLKLKQETRVRIRPPQPKPEDTTSSNPTSTSNSTLTRKSTRKRKIKVRTPSPIKKPRNPNWRQYQWRCQFCSRSFAQRKGLEAHQEAKKILNDDDSNSAKCDTCGKICGSLCQLRKHQFTHTRRFPCNVCPSSFVSPSKLAVHVRVNHTKIKPFKCGTCDLKFAADWERLRHEKRLCRFVRIQQRSSSLSSAGQGSVPEGQGQKLRKSKGPRANRKLNFNANTKTKPAKLKKAKVMTKLKAKAKPAQNRKKIKIKSKTRNFKCDICSASFSSNPSLQRHSLIHTGQMPFSCRFCLRKFNQVGNVRRHELKMHKDDLLITSTSSLAQVQFEHETENDDEMGMGMQFLENQNQNEYYEATTDMNMGYAVDEGNFEAEADGNENGVVETEPGPDTSSPVIVSSYSMLQGAA